MNGQDLFIERETIKKSMNTSLAKAHNSGHEFAEKTRDYRIALAQKILQLKADGMQISIIEKVAKGDEEVAQKEFEMMCAEVNYKASNENVNIKKKEYDGVLQDIKREFYTPEEK